MATQHLYRIFSASFGCAAAAFLMGGLTAVGQPNPPAPPPPPEKPPGWEASAAAGLTLTAGNSESFLATLTFNANRKWEKNEILLGAGFGYGETTSFEWGDPDNGTKTKSQDYLSGYGQFNHLFTERLYGALRLDALHDDISDINYRFTISPLVGYYFIKEKRTTLSVEAGPSLIIEERGGEDRSYWGLRVADRFDHQLTATTKIWQFAEYIPQVDDFNNYLVNLELGIDTKITKAASLRVVLIDNYVNQPARHRRANDVKLIAGVAYTF